MAFKKTLAILVLFSLLVSLTACGDEPDVKNVISKMLACELTAPAGKIYISDAAPGTDEYISESLFSALFPKSGEPKLIEAYAIRISSFTAPYEYAVFKAKTIDDTEQIAKMCYGRIENAKALLARSGSDFKSQLPGSAVVHITGKYVIYAMTDANDRFIDAAKKALH